jgi:hypothetical protein
MQPDVQDFCHASFSLLHIHLFHEPYLIQSKGKLTFDYINVHILSFQSSDRFFMELDT